MSLNSHFSAVGSQTFYWYLGQHESPGGGGEVFDVWTESRLQYSPLSRSSSPTYFGPATLLHSTDHNSQANTHGKVVSVVLAFILLFLYLGLYAYHKVCSMLGSWDRATELTALGGIENVRRQCLQTNRGKSYAAEPSRYLWS